MNAKVPCQECGHGICQCYVCPLCWGLNACDIGYCEERAEDRLEDEDDY